ncbi:hypothetical protein EE612_009457, partial [Oryza sativa]
LQGLAGDGDGDQSAPDLADGGNSTPNPPRRRRALARRRRPPPRRRGEGAAGVRGEPAERLLRHQRELHPRLHLQRHLRLRRRRGALRRVPGVPLLPAPLRLRRLHLLPPQRRRRRRRRLQRRRPGRPRRRRPPRARARAVRLLPGRLLPAQRLPHHPRHRRRDLLHHRQPHLPGPLDVPGSHRAESPPRQPRPRRRRQPHRPAPLRLPLAAAGRRGRQAHGHLPRHLGRHRPRLGGDYPLDLAMAVASLAARCVARQPTARPAMDEVFVSLAAVYGSTVDWNPSDHGNSGSSLIGR